MTDLLWTQNNNNNYIQQYSFFTGTENKHTYFRKHTQIHKKIDDNPEC